MAEERDRINDICQNLNIKNPLNRVCTKADARNAADNALRGKIPESFLYMNSDVWVNGTHPLSNTDMTDTIAQGIENWGFKRDFGQEVSPLSPVTADQVAQIHSAIVQGLTMLEEARDLVFPGGHYWQTDAEIVRSHVAQDHLVSKVPWNWNLALQWLNITIPTARAMEQRWRNVVKIASGL